MSNNKPILFVDLLHSEHGSYDDDFAAIRKAMPSVGCDYLKCDVRDGFGGILKTLKSALTFRYSRVVFLSAKVNQLAALAPLALVLKTHAIYHFMPNSRARLHTRLLPILDKFFSFATYADGVSGQLRNVIGARPPALPSRIVEKPVSEALLREKFATTALRVLIPGVRPGVRKFINPIVLLAQLEEKLAVRDIRIFIQGDPVAQFQGHPAIEFVRKGIPKDEYSALYNSCHIIAVDFEESYEVRASGVILDAIAAGCIVLTTDHPINRGYGFPDTLVCDADRLARLTSLIRSGQSLQHLIPGAGIEEFGQRWREFLNL